jgi:tetratricopeptide (TPR) repeat protein
MNDSDALIKRATELEMGDKPDEAMEVLNRVLLAEPDNHKAIFVAGLVLQKADRHVQAIQLFKRVTELKPHDHRAYGQLALLLGETHKYDESVRYAERALQIRREVKTVADASFAHTNAGNWETAEKLAQEALKMDPECLDARVQMANILLAKQDWERGFAAWRVTLRTKYRKEWRYGDTEEWQGEPGAVVMTTGEQGLGDEIMAASVVPDAIRGCRRFILDCDQRLMALFRRSFPDAIVVGSRWRDTVTLPVAPTHHKSMFGLSELFRKRDGDFPRQPYLIANERYRAMFREYFDGQRVIGLAWSGGFPRTGLEQRTAGLNAFMPLLRKGGAEFVSLQYKDDAEEVRECEKTHGIKIHRVPWATMSGDMDLIAGLIASLDEVVGVHTTALHLSSALGVPTTVLTHRGSGWRYAPEELLWYPPTTRTVKKRPGESWRECAARAVEGPQRRAA